MPVIPIAADVWPKTSVKDVAESLGLNNLSDEAAAALAADVEFRLNQIIEESIKFMRHSKRTSLEVSDVDYALRAKNIEPLWGFASTDTLSFRRATSAVGNLYFIDDEEIDLTKIVTAKLPAVPRETSYTAHWLAVEGVQPAIPQNPSDADLKNHPAFSASQRTSPSSVSKPTKDSTRPTTKQHLSRELRLYFDRVTAAAYSDDPSAKTAALASLSGDPGLHQLVPYLIQFVAEKITSILTRSDPNLDQLRDTIHILEAVLTNPHSYLEPYLHQILPSILTCLLSSSLSSSTMTPSEREIRQLSGSLLAAQLTRYQQSYPTLRTRILKTLTKTLVTPQGSDGSRLGAIIGLKFLGKESTRVVLGQNMKALGECLDKDVAAGKLSETTVQEIVDETIKTMSGFSEVDYTVLPPKTKRKLQIIPAQDELEAEVGVLFAAKLMSTSDELETRLAYGFVKESMYLTGQASDDDEEEQEEEQVRTEDNQKMDLEEAPIPAQSQDKENSAAQHTTGGAEIIETEKAASQKPLEQDQEVVKTPETQEIEKNPRATSQAEPDKDEDVDDDMVLGSDDAPTTCPLPE